MLGKKASVHKVFDEVTTFGFGKTPLFMTSTEKFQILLGTNLLNVHTNFGTAQRILVESLLSPTLTFVPGLLIFLLTLGPHSVVLADGGRTTSSGARSRTR